MTSGCFRYLPVPLEATPDGQDVRLLVTRQGASELNEVANVDGAVPTLTGTIVSREGRELLLNVPVGQRQDGFHTASINQTIRVPMGEILQVERRELDKAKTGLLLGGAAAGSAFIIFSIMDAFGGDSSGSPPDLNESRIPIPFLSIPIGR
jgi:hypothetical protein